MTWPLILSRSEWSGKGMSTYNSKTCKSTWPRYAMKAQGEIFFGRGQKKKKKNLAEQVTLELNLDRWAEFRQRIKK